MGARRPLASPSCRPTPGPETDDANGDPMVITRYLYKPTAAEGLTRFNDNQRLHVFVVDVGTRAGARSSPTARSTSTRSTGRRTATRSLFVSNREADADKTFNYDVFAVRVQDGAVRRLTNTKSAEYAPVWSPDGTRIAFLGTQRDLTSSETTMEDTHVWVMNADGIEPRRDRRGHRQPPGRAAVVGRRPAASTSRCRSAATSRLVRDCRPRGGAAEPRA